MLAASATTASIGGAPDAVLWEISFVVIWICPLALRTSADIFCWDGEGPQGAKGHFKDWVPTVLCS